MSDASLRRRLARLLDLAGITIDGPAPHDIQVHDPRLYARVIAGGSLALGEAYMDRWWDCEQLDAFIARVLRARLDERVRPRAWLGAFLRARLRNLQTRRRSRRAIGRHYDLGNDLYRAMLDRRLIYSCGFWQDAADLDQAQEHKLELVARKLQLAPGMRVLDIGCGWGGTARYLAETRGVEVVGVTLSQQQVDLGRQMCRGLPVEIRRQDYRDLDDRFDRILSLGMIEHVGWRNYRTFMRTVRRNLADDGLLLLHTIGNNRSVRHGDAWMDRYIFPDGMLPSVRQLADASEGLLVMEDWHGFGPDYDRTLLAWHANFVRHWPELSSRLDDRFFRMWTYYLLSCAGSFRARKNQVWQVVFSPHGIAGGYRAPRSAVEASGAQDPAAVPAEQAVAPSRDDSRRARQRCRTRRATAGGPAPRTRAR
jgi:cyclopropane-fatty-acyl-phospholipid synthase